MTARDAEYENGVSYSFLGGREGLHISCVEVQTRVAIDLMWEGSFTDRPEGWAVGPTTAEELSDLQEESHRDLWLC